MKTTDNPQENFLDDLHALCKKYSTNGEYEWRVNYEGNDAIGIKYLWVAVPEGGANEPRH